VTAKTRKEHGAAKVEPDEYTLEQGGQVLRLVTGGETMEFHKQPFAKDPPGNKRSMSMEVMP
jgi:hypothetical protein